MGQLEFFGDSGSGGQRTIYKGPNLRLSEPSQEDS